MFQPLCKGSPTEAGQTNPVTEFLTNAPREPPFAGGFDWTGASTPRPQSTEKEWMTMHKGMGSAVTGVALTMAVGTAAYLMASRSMKPQRKAIKRTANKAMRAVEDVVDNVSSMMR